VTIEKAPRNALADANHCLNGSLFQCRSPVAPLPEEEGYRQQRIGREARGANPDAAGAPPAPISPFAPTQSTGRHAGPMMATADRVMTGGEGIKIAVANGHRLMHDAAEHRFKANPARCSGHFWVGSMMRAIRSRFSAERPARG